MAAPSMKNSARTRVSHTSQEEEEQDRISCLPAELIETILCHLSLREAVRTSILSRRWRYMWTTLRQLVFDTNCTPFPFEYKSTTDRMVKIIDSVLLLHWGPIEKFKVSLEKKNPGTRDINRWIRYLSNSRISLTDLTLQFQDPVKYYCKIPSCLFHCRDLVKLELHNCSLKLPHAFQGFKNLERLTLYYVELSQGSLEKLISGCPQLSELTLAPADDVTCLTIDSPNLQYFDIEGCLEGICFRRNSLTRVKISMLDWFNNDLAQASEYSSNLQKFFARLPLISDLRILEDSLKYLSAGEVPAMLPNRILNLDYLQINLDLFCLEDILSTLCLLRSSPNLEEIELSPDQLILFHNEKSLRFVWSMNHPKLLSNLLQGLEREIVLDHVDTIEDCSEVFSSPCPLEALWSVCVSSIQGSRLEIGFLKFLLLNSPGLERMTVSISDCAVHAIGADELLEELEQSPRASDQVEFQVIGRSREERVVAV